MYNKTCVCFSYFINNNKIDLSNWYIKLLRSIFNDNDIFIGINDGSLNPFDHEPCGDITYSKIQNNIYVDSDVPGFQTAIDLLFNSKNEYKYILFAHTKGGSYVNTEQSSHIRHLIKKLYFDKLSEIIEIMENNKNIGISGYWFMLDGVNILDYYKSLEVFKIDVSKIVSGFYANTFYIIKYEIVKKFLEENQLFPKLKLNEHGFNRYFFESFFPKIVKNYGFDMCLLFEDKDFEII